MKNSMERVPQFVFGSIILYLLFSVLAYAFNFKWHPFQKVNLISEIVKRDSPSVKKKFIAVVTKHDSIIVAPVATKKESSKNFLLYLKPHFITNFDADTNAPALSNFLQKLYDLKKGKKRKIRIGYFGDSMIEGDLLTQTLRKLLQKEFGGAGVGFVPITSEVSKYRFSVIANYSDGWQDENFKTEHSNNKLFLSGHLFHAVNDWVEMKDQTITDSAPLLEKILLCGHADQTIPVTINNIGLKLNPDKIFNRIVLNSDINHSIKMAVSNNDLPVYGISFESESGIILDNFSFRGISGFELNKIDTSFLKAIAENDPYDLLIFQYGINVLFRPNDKNFDWYSRVMIPLIAKFKNCFKGTDFLIVSTTDRAFRYDDEFKSAIGIDSLIKTQAQIAFETGCSFYNQFETMGGHNSIVDWVDQDPPLAKKDYIHPNGHGAEILGRYLYAAFMKDYKKYTDSLK